MGVVAILLWASLALLTSQAHGVPPFELLALSFGVAFLAGLAVQAVRGRAALAELRQPAAPWLWAFCGIFLYHALYFFALANAPPARASLIAYLWPLLIVLLAAALSATEGLRARHLAGALLGLAGTALLLTTGAGYGTGSASAAGYGAALGCALVWSVYSVVNRRFASTPSGMLVGVCGAVAVAGGLCHLAFERITVCPDAGQWPAIVLLGIGPTGLAFLAWDHATKHGRLPILGALSYLAPVTSTLLLVLAGQTAPTGRLFLAAVLTTGGALMATGLGMRRRVSAA